MFDYTHYVPVLRWKRAEWVALKELNSEIKRRITPLIEFLPSKLNILEEEKLRKNIHETCENLNKSWGNRDIFIDFLHCPNQKRKVLRRMQVLSQKMNLNLIPVVHLKQNENWRKMVSSHIKEHGVSACIRLNLKNVKSSDFHTQIENLLTDLNVKPKDVNLIIDCGLIIDNQKPSIRRILSLTPFLNDWLTLSVLGGAFPKNLTDFRPGIHSLSRLDWIWWRRQIEENKMSRIPTFGDFTIQHAFYEEPPSYSNPSASIRYSANDYWVIMRGEGLRSEKSTGFEQYYANAALLRDRDEFLGADYCEGDRYIDERGRLADKTGTPETWLRAGINHHITLTVNQLANLDEI